jgi:hypothetical protein
MMTVVPDRSPGMLNRRRDDLARGAASNRADRETRYRR